MQAVFICALCGLMGGKVNHVIRRVLLGLYLAELDFIMWRSLLVTDGEEKRDETRPVCAG